MFKIHIHDGKEQLPNDDIYYIVAKNGLFLKKKLDLLESLVPVSNISFLKDIQISAKMSIPTKIPNVMFSDIVNFFRDVFDKYHAEAVVLLFYNKSTKDYKVVVPEQIITYASSDYKRQVSIPGYEMIGSIHSHPNFRSSASFIDHNDEKSFDGLHIIVGNITMPTVSVSTYIVANGIHFLCKNTDYICIKEPPIISRQPSTFSKYMTNLQPKFREINNFFRKNNRLIVKDIEEEKEEEIHCLTCKHRNEKIELEEFELDEEDIFKCTSCGTFFVDEERCPTCQGFEKKNITDQLLTDNYKPVGLVSCSSCGLVFNSDVFLSCPHCEGIRGVR